MLHGVFKMSVWAAKIGHFENVTPETRDVHSLFTEPSEIRSCGGIEKMCHKTTSASQHTAQTQKNESPVWKANMHGIRMSATIEIVGNDWRGLKRVSNHVLIMTAMEPFCAMIAS